MNSSKSCIVSLLSETHSMYATHTCSKYILFTTRTKKHISEDLDTFIKTLISKYSKQEFYTCTDEDKAVLSKMGQSRMYYTTPMCSGKCIIASICALNYIRSNPLLGYEPFGIIVGFSGEPLTGYTRVPDAPHTLALFYNKAHQEYVAIDLTMIITTKKAHVFAAKYMDTLLRLVTIRYGVYQDDIPWKYLTIEAEKNIYSVYSNIVHKTMQ